MDRSFYHFVTKHAFDRLTDRRTEFSSLDRVCILCSVVETEVFFIMLQIPEPAHWCPAKRSYCWTQGSVISQFASARQWWPQRRWCHTRGI